MHVKAADSLRQARKVPFSAEKEERELPDSAQESKGPGSCDRAPRPWDAGTEGTRPAPAHAARQREAASKDQKKS